MTQQFDSLWEQMLQEMMPADISGFDGGFGGAVKHVKKGVPGGEAKGHWSPLQKLSDEDREKVLQEIFKEVFSEKENTFAPTVDNPEDLHNAIKSAIQTVSGRTGLKAAGNWAAKFLADRIMTLLKNNVKYTTSGGEEVQKDVTQKEFKQALNKALEDAPTEAPTEPTADTSSKETKEPSSAEKEVEVVYSKAADLNSDDSELQKAFNKLPSDKDMSWEEVLKIVGMTKGLALIDNGGLIETEKEKQSSEEEEVKDLEFNDDDELESKGYESEFDRAMRDIDSFRTSKSYNSNSWD